MTLAYRPGRGIALVLASQAIGVGTSLVLSGVQADRFTVAFLRFAFGVLVLLPALPAVVRLPRRAWAGAAVYAADVALFVIALQYAPLALVVAIAAGAPLVAAVAERLRGSAALTRWGVAAVVLATAGAVVAAAGVPLTGGTPVGIALAIASTIACALGTVLIGEHSESSSWALTQAVNIAGVVLLLPFVAVIGLQLSGQAIGAAALAAVGGGGLAAVAFIASLRCLPASVAMAVSTIGLPAAAVLGVVLLGQPVTLVAAAGYAMVFAATLLSAMRPVVAAAPPATPGSR